MSSPKGGAAALEERPSRAILHSRSASAADAGDASDEKEVEECCVCLEAFTETSTCANFPCSHRVHTSCMENLRKWGLHTHCPLCRAKLPPGPEQLFEVGGRKFLRVELRIIHGNRMKHQFLSKNGTRWGALTAEEQAIMDEVVAMWTQAAQQGHIPAQRNLAELFLEGHGVKKCGSKAAQWFLRAAEQGDALSQSALGAMYLEGKAVRKHEAKALRWFRKAAAQDDATAQLALAHAHAHGHGVKEKSDRVALSFLKKAAKQGHPDACAELGSWFLNGRDGLLQPSDTLAEEWLQKAADSGHALSADLLEDMKSYRIAAADMEEGRGEVGGGRSGARPPEALYAEAMDKYDSIISRSLRANIASPSSSSTSSSSDDHVQDQMASVLQLLHEAAFREFAAAQYTLGVIYHDGQGVEQNYSEAALWWRMAAVEGDTEAMVRLGCLHEAGLGVERTTAVALQWWRRAAGAHHPTAEYHLGRTSRNRRAAEAWYRRAAEQGHDQAQLCLARCLMTYDDGGGGDDDEEAESSSPANIAVVPNEAWRWLRQSASWKNGEANLLLGTLLSSHRLSSEHASTAEAERHYRAAAAQGVREAHAQLERLQRRTEAGATDATPRSLYTAAKAIYDRISTQRAGSWSMLSSAEQRDMEICVELLKDCSAAVGRGTRECSAAALEADKEDLEFATLSRATLSSIFAHGQGVQKDTRKASAWLQAVRTDETVP